MRAAIDDGRAVRRIAYVVLVLLVATGIRIGSAGDAPVRWFTAAIFGFCALSLARKLWSTRGSALPLAADPPPRFPDSQSDFGVADDADAADPPARP